MATVQIRTKADYTKALSEINILMEKDDAKSLTPVETKRLKALAKQVEQYEERKVPIPKKPKTLAGLIELKMLEGKLKQKEIARKLKVSETKFSLIMSGKQRPDVAFLKAVHDKLKVDGDTIFSVL